MKNGSHGGHGGTEGLNRVWGFLGRVQGSCIVRSYLLLWYRAWLSSVQKLGSELESFGQQGASILI